jgi:hypothetical protein
MNAPRELDVAELAHVYRLLNPAQVYYGDPPEKWTRNILNREIRLVLTRPEPPITDADRARAGGQRRKWTAGDVHPDWGDRPLTAEEAAALNSRPAS